MPNIGEALKKAFNPLRIGALALALGIVIGASILYPTPAQPTSKPAAVLLATEARIKETLPPTTQPEQPPQPGEKATSSNWKLIGPIAGFGILGLITLVALLRPKMKGAGGVIGKTGTKLSGFMSTVTGRFGWLRLVALGLYLFLLVAGQNLYPNQWNWFWARGAFYCWTALVSIGVLLALRPKRSVWVTGTALALLLVAYPLKKPAREVWREIGKSAAGLESKPTTQPVMTTKSGTTKIVIAKPEKWSEPYICIPPNCSFRILPEKAVRVKTGSGKERIIDPVKWRYLDKVPLLEATFSFKAEGNEPVTVVVEWTPR